MEVDPDEPRTNLERESGAGWEWEKEKGR